MPTLGQIYVWPNLEKARRANAWRAYYIARGVGIFRAGEFGRRKADKAIGWPPA